MTYQAGQRVKVSERLRNAHPKSPIAGQVLPVCEPGPHWSGAHEVPIVYDGTVYYVAVEYVEAVTEEEQGL